MANRGDKSNENLGRVGSYELMELIGRGGMGVVYKAKQIGLERIVAVKMILDAYLASPEDRVRFQAEAKTAASLMHPGIVAIHEIGEHQGQPYFSMDFVEGPTLANVVKNSPIPAREAAGLIREVAGAVAHAHANGILHRDLKPSNILLDKEGHPHIADFGLAKRVQGAGDLTQSGQILGTPGYMPPEQAAGQLQKIGPQSDVYGLGAVMYAALTGVPPFRGGNQAELLRSALEDLPVRPRNLVPSLDRDAENICLKCLEKRIGDRYASVTALADDLSRYLNGDPISARPHGYGRVLWHWARRPQRTSEAATVILVLAAFFGLCAVMGFCMLLFNWVPTTNPAEAAAIVALDFLGLALCLPVGLGILAAKRWLIVSGFLVGGGIIVGALMLMGMGFNAGGLLSDPFQRVAIYTIFGFVGCAMIGICTIAMVAHTSRESEESTTSIKKLLAGSTKSTDDCASTDVQPKPIGPA